MIQKAILIVSIVFSEISFGLERAFPKPVTNWFPTFLQSYEKVRRWEGNYSYVEYDKGGETYAGIARKFNKRWEGWEVLDNYKKDSVIHWNKKISDVEKHVMEYYYDIWMRDGYYKINDPIVRDYLFDYRNSGPIAYRHVKQVLDGMGICGLDNKAVLDEKTIDAINKSNQIVFILRLQETRRGYYESVVDANPEMNKFLKGWINRTNNIIS